MGRQVRYAVAILAALVVSYAEPGAARAIVFGIQEPVRVYTVPPRAAAPRPSFGDLFADRLGPRTASSAVGAPGEDVSERAKLLPRRGQGARQYGDLRVTVYEMVDESTAYAMLRYLRPEGAATTAEGDDGWAGDTSSALRVGHFTILLEGGSVAAREGVASALVERIARPQPSAPLLAELPEQGRIAGTERYAPSFETLRRVRPDLTEDVFLLGAGGADAAVADYEQPGGAPMRLLLVDYQTPQLAADAERSLGAYFAALPPETQQQRILEREGNYMIEAVGVTDRAAAARLVGGVKYSFDIKMLQGPNPGGVMLDLNEETYKAALVFIHSFTIVGFGFLGALACGIVAGTVVFRRRRRAAADVFSDAGGMIHLDLEELNHSRRLPAANGVGLLPSGPAD